MREYDALGNPRQNCAVRSRQREETPETGVHHLHTVVDQVRHALLNCDRIDAWRYGERAGIRFADVLSDLDKRQTAASARAKDAIAIAEPHCPAPVSVTIALVPASLLKKTCGTAVLGLCEPTGETPSYL